MLSLGPLLRRRARWARFSAWAILIAFAAVGTVQAADKYWTGATSNDWGTNGNWSGNAPSAGDVGVFNSTFTLQPTLTGNKSAGGIWVTGAIEQDVTVGGTYILTLSGTTINGTANLGILIDNANSFRLTINAPVKIGNAQTWRNSSGNLFTVGGNIDLNGKAFTIDGTGNTTITGVMSGGGAFTKNGTGTLTLTGTNTYTGSTTVSDGILNIRNSAAFGATGGGVSVSSGAELQVQGGISVGNEALTLNGTGVSGSGALRSLSGNNSWSGGLTLGSAATIDSVAGTLTLSGSINTGGHLLTTVGAGDLTFGGVLSGAGGITKTGTGTLTLTNSANTYTGMTTVKEGLLLINTANKESGFAGDLTVGDGVGAADSAILRLTQDKQLPKDADIFIMSDGWLDTNGVNNDNMSSLNFVGGHLTTGVDVFKLNGDLTSNASSSTALLEGELNIVGATRTFTVANGGTGTDVRIAGVLSGSVSMIKAGLGTLRLEGNNTITSAITISAGTIVVAANNALGTSAGATSITAGARLAFDGGIAYTTAEAVTVNGSGIGGTGVVLNLGGTNSFSGVLTMGSASTFGSDAGSLTLSANLANAGFGLTATGAGDLAFTGIVNGTGGWTRTGTGTLTLSGANTTSGVITLSGGVLSVATIGDGGVVGNLGAASSAASNLVFDGGTLRYTGVTASTNRNFTINSGKTATIDVATNALTLNGAAVASPGALTKIGNGTLVLSGANAYTGATTINAGTLKQGAANVISDSSAVIVAGGAIYDLSGFNETIGSLAGSGTVTSGAAGAITLTVGGNNASTSFSGMMQNGSGMVTLTKNGSGTFTLSGANTYSGLTTVSAGVLNIQNAAALGTTAAGTTVSAGAALQIQGGIAVGAEGLTLHGGGISSDGALRSISGSNSWSGSVTLGSAATMASDSGALTVSGTIANAGYELTASGAGDIALTGVVGGSGGLTKTGTGTVTLSAANTFTGVVTLTNGVLRVVTIGDGGVSGNLGSASGAASNIVFNGGTLRYTGATASTNRNFTINSGKTATIEVTTNTLTLSGSAIATNGALAKMGSGTLVLSGANAYSGATSVNAGVLNIQNAAALGSTAAGTTVNSGAALQIQGDIAIGAETLTLNGGGISNDGALRNISGTNSWSGNLALGSTSTIASDFGILTLSGTITNGSFGLTIGGVGNVAASNIVSGSGGLTKNGNGTLLLSGANTYSGATLVSGGVLNLQNAMGLGSTAAGTSVSSGAALQLQGGIYIGAESLTLNGDGVAGDGALRNVSGDNSWSGDLTLGSASTIASDAGTLTLSATIANGGNLLTVSGAGNVTASNVISGAAGLTKNGSGILNLNAANTYVGANIINGGVVAINSNASLGNSGNSVTLNAATLQVTSTFVAARALVVGSAASTILVNSSQTFTINAGITGSGALNKTGAGTLTLASNNSYVGVTNVAAGTLNVTGSIGSSAVTISSGAALTGTGTTGVVTASAGSTVAPGNGGAGILSTGSFNGNASFTLSMQIGGTIVGSQYDQLSVTGSVTLAGNLQVSLINGFIPSHGDKFFLIINDGTDAVNGTFSGLYQDSIILVDGYDFSISYAGDWAVLSASGGNDVVLTVVPEPSTFETILMGFSFLLLFQRARARAYRNGKHITAK